MSTPAWLNGSAWRVSSTHAQFATEGKAHEMASAAGKGNVKPFVLSYRMLDILENIIVDISFCLGL